MYKLILILRYLRRKLAPMFAALAVTLCTAMVIIVISIMGGFLDMMRASAKKLTGDVILRANITGFPNYEEMLAGLIELPEVVAATPLLRTYGLINLEGRTQTVEVEGIEAESFARVSGYDKALYWSAERLSDPPPKAGSLAANLAAHDRGWIEHMDFQHYGMTFEPPPEWGKRPGLVAGIAMFNRRDENGHYHLRSGAVSAGATLTVVPISLAGQPIQSETRAFTVVNEFKSGLYDIDANRVYVPFALLQKLLHMDAVDSFDDEGHATGAKTQARATEIMIRGKDGLPLEAVEKAVTDYVQKYLNAHASMPGISVMTWKERHGTFLGAVEKEKLLLTILFAIISVVAVAMIAVIFYMIVLEKTRDIGVLRALGASRGGVASIFLGYGLAIGIVGAAMGLALATLVVVNINEIQDYLGTSFGVTVYFIIAALAALFTGLVAGFFIGGYMRRFNLWMTVSLVLSLVIWIGAAVGGLYWLPPLRPWLNRFNFVVWNPEIYYFDQIPGKLNPHEVTFILIAAVLSSVVGSLIPAFLASRLDPVESLRYE